SLLLGLILYWSLFGRNDGMSVDHGRQRELGTWRKLWRRPTIMMCLLAIAVVAACQVAWDDAMRSVATSLRERMRRRNIEISYLFMMRGFGSVIGSVVGAVAGDLFMRRSGRGHVAVLLVGLLVVPLWVASVGFSPLSLFQARMAGAGYGFFLGLFV